MPRPAKSAEEHWLGGTKPVAAGANAAEVEPGRPKFPKDLSREARSIFKRIVRLLENRRHITEGDVELLRIYALTYVRHAKAVAKLEAEGEVKVYVRLDSNGQPHDQEKPNYWLKIAETAEKNMVACLDRLGLTAMNRSKVKPTGKPEDATPGDPMEEFLSGRRRSAAEEPTELDEETLQ